MTPIEVTFEIYDGYVGGFRPHTFPVYVEDFIDLSPEEIEGHLLEIAHEEMMSIVHANVLDLQGTALKIAEKAGELDED